MADINVERKKKSIWPWILGAIALLLLIWAFAAMNDNAERTTAATPAAVTDQTAVDADTDTTAVTQTAADADTTTETPPPPTD